MKINITSEYTIYNHLSKLGAERSPRFIKNLTKEESGADVIELSEEARMKFQQKKDTLDKILRGLHISRDVLNDVKKLIYDSDDDYIARKARLDELKAEITGGAYDFDSGYKLSILADAALSYMP